MSDNSGPAFPTPYITRDGDTFSTDYQNGMTKREYFAGLAMQAYLSDSGWAPELRRLAQLNCIGAEFLVARLALEQADAMLAESQK